MRKLLFILFIFSLLLLAGCKKPECEKNSDCSSPPGPRNMFDISCKGNKCSYEPVPGKCGNTLCEKERYNENNCNCDRDCKPACTGAAKISVAGRETISQYMTQSCDKSNICVADLDVRTQKPITFDDTITSSGNKFTLSSAFNQPFNLKRDTFGITLTLDSLGSGVSEVMIKKMTLTATTTDGRQVILAQQNVDRTLLAVDTRVKQDLRIRYDSGDVENHVSSVKLKITYSYRIKSGSSQTEKAGELAYSYKWPKFFYVKPQKEYNTCPEDCDDGDPSTRDYCGSETDYFCEHVAKAGVCGNGLCDSGETKCNCAEDCGSCQGAAGKYLSYRCDGEDCRAILNPGVINEPKTIFSEFSQSGFKAETRVTYSNPFLVTNSFLVNIKLASTTSEFGSLNIVQAQLLSGQQEVGIAKLNKQLTAGSPLQFSIPLSISVSGEKEMSLTMKLSYDYTKSGKKASYDYSKSLEKMTFIGLT